MKRAVLISLFIFWTVFVGIVAAGKVFGPDDEGGVVSTTPAVNTNLFGITLNAAEVAKHNTQGNCWMIISGNVYDITSYFGAHPGGNITMTPFCGKDATKPYQTKDRVLGQNHSSYASTLLAKYLLGPVGKVFPAGTAPATTPAPMSTGSAATSSSAPASNITLTAAEVAKHNSVSSCWLILSGGVYNLTSYRSSHSGGASTIPCGVDGTSTIIGKHGSSYISQLASYRIGTIGQSVSTTTTSPAVASPPVSAEGDDEDDD